MSPSALFEPAEALVALGALSASICFWMSCRAAAAVRSVRRERAVRSGGAERAGACGGGRPTEELGGRPIGAVIAGRPLILEAGRGRGVVGGGTGGDGGGWAAPYLVAAVHEAPKELLLT